jgi:hypothetical protein
MPARLFPPPWSVEEQDAYFVMREWGVCLSAPQVCYVRRVSGGPCQHAAITPGTVFARCDARPRLLCCPRLQRPAARVRLF